MVAAVTSFLQDAGINNATWSTKRRRTIRSRLQSVFCRWRVAVGIGALPGETVKVFKILPGGVSALHRRETAFLEAVCGVEAHAESIDNTNLEPKWIKNRTQKLTKNKRKTKTKLETNEREWDNLQYYSSRWEIKQILRKNKIKRGRFENYARLTSIELQYFDVRTDLMLQPGQSSDPEDLPSADVFSFILFLDLFLQPLDLVRRDGSHR